MKHANSMLEDGEQKQDIVYVPKANVPREFIIKCSTSNRILAYASSLYRVQKTKWWARTIIKHTVINQWLSDTDSNDGNVSVLAIRGTNEVYNKNTTCAEIDLIEKKIYILSTIDKKNREIGASYAVHFLDIWLARNNRTAWGICSECTHDE